MIGQRERMRQRNSQKEEIESREWRREQERLVGKRFTREETKQRSWRKRHRCYDKGTEMAKEGGKGE